MILPVFLYGSPVLRKQAREIETKTDELDTLIQNMYETMKQSDGVGLAGPQIGKSLQIFVVDGTPYIEDQPEMANFKQVFINPEIIEKKGDDVSYNEGCLSIPDIHEDVTRPEKIRIRYLDADLNEHEEEYDGMKARIIQHEYDHLQGILFIDRLSPLRKRLLRGKLHAIAKGKTSVKYKSKVSK